MTAQWRCILVMFLLLNGIADAQVRISEFMASNAGTLADEDGDFEDWIEIHNFSPSPVNLYNWSLTDNAGDLTKWRFPATNLPPDGFLLVFASDKDRHTAGAPLHTNFKLEASGEFLALVDLTGTNVVSEFAPTYPPQVTDVSFGFALTASNVTLVTTGAMARVLVPSVSNGGNMLNYMWTGDLANEPFDTTSWTSGATGVGFNAGSAGDIALNIQSTMLNNNASVFIRLPFVVSNPTNFSLLTLRIKYDDAYVAWVNGVELTRANAPAEDLNWNSSAVLAHTASAFESVSLGVDTSLLTSGTNILAIQGLNITAGDGTFLLLPELKGTTVAGESTSGLYFTQPTPGAENLGGATAPGPGITDITHTPNVSLDNDNLTVTARVFPTAHPVSTVTLTYRVMFNPEVSVPMFDNGTHGDGVAGDGIYGATIPASASTTGQMVRYYVTAKDSINTVSRLPVFTDPASTAEYFGTVINPDYVNSTLPIVHLFAPPSVLQPGPGSAQQIGADSKVGAKVSLYYDGEFYDNVQMQLRGNTTAGFDKKSHRLEFNREHPFRYSNSTERIRKTSFVADYGDPTYMRQGLSYWLCVEIGAAGPFYSPFRLQLNGAFYQLANHNDVHGEELLERLGYDPNGALYNAAGTIQSSFYSTGGFEKKTRKWEDNDDYTALANAISETLSAGQRRTNIFDRLDIPEVISYMVAARIAHENDDVWANMSLYHDNDGDDLWRIIPFDMNLSWGAAFMDTPDYSGIQVTNDNLKSHPLYGSSQAVPASGSRGWNRMYDVIFQVPQTREMFLRRMRTVLDTYVTPPGTPSALVPLEQKAIQWRNQIATEATLDRNWWGWPSKSGQCNFDPGITLSNGVNDLINEFINKRRLHFYGKHSITNTALPIGITKFSNAGIPLAQPANTVVSIVGWDDNPASGNQDEEYVVLSNANHYAVDISGWELDGGIHYKFKGGTVIPSSGMLYVSPNTKAFRNRSASPHGGQGFFVVGPYAGHLNAWGEALTLTDDKNRLVSTNIFPGNPSLAQRYLRVTEIMYNPSPFLSVTNDEQQFEYIELRNISTNVTLNLNGVRFTNGIYFNFTGNAVTSLAPQQSVLLVRNQAAFTARYGSGFSIAGQFTGALDSAGETLRLEDAAGEKILEFAYNNNWYPITDGLGFSLVIVDENAPWSSWTQKTSWRASGNLNGSPGAVDPVPPTFSPIVVNEALTHTDLPERDSIELYNPTTNWVNVGGWFLTDDFYTPKKYRIPDGTTIQPGSYLVVDDSQFGVGSNGFRFSELGESVYLFSGGAGTNLTGYYHGFEFGGAPNGVSFGFYTNSQGDVHFVLESAATLGTNNAYPRVGPVVISEIMYHPPDVNGTNNYLDEFIELQNITASSVLLYDPGAPTNTWRVRNAVDFDFPPNQTLAAGAMLLLVGFDPTNAPQLAAFRGRYGISDNVAVYGPWSGKLDNADEAIELKQPGPPDDTLVVPFYMTEKVQYQDDPPWPTGADGIGNSFQRVSSTGFGDDPTNWFAAGVTAGRATVANVAPTVAITSPTSGAQVDSTNGVVVSVVASDPDGSISLVKLLADGAELGEWSVTSSNYFWSGPAAGQHELQASVTDNLGAISVSDPVIVNVTAPLPTVALTIPTNGAIFVSGLSVALTASATSGSGPASWVEFYVDGSLIGATGQPFTLNWTANPSGNHTLSAIAYDAVGQSSLPATALITVQAAMQDPVLIAASSSGWKYLDDGSDLGTNWTGLTFDDNSWSNGVAQLGFGNNGEVTTIRRENSLGTTITTFYFRKEFVVPSVSGINDVTLRVVRDDGAIGYVNGVEVFRSNMPEGPVNYLTRASANVYGAEERVFHSTNFSPALLSVGTNILAVEVHQDQLTSSDTSMNAELTLDGFWLGPAITNEPKDINATIGSDATFEVGCVGTAPLTYHWFADNEPLSCDTSSLTITNVQADHAGPYYVVVSNFIDVVTSIVATLELDSDDTDGDGMPNDWELANGTNPLVNDANEDPDFDRMANWQEYLAGTSPTDGASVLKIESALLTGTKIALSFSAISNHNYSVQTRLILGGVWQKWQDVAAAPSNRTVRLTNDALAATNHLYRLVTPVQP